MPRWIRLLLLCLLVMLWPAAMAAQETPPQDAGDPGTLPAEWRIDFDRSVFAVITHKDGLAARLAHDHIVTAQDVEAKLLFDPADPAAVDFRFTAPAAKLRIDEPADQARWYPAIEKLGILDQAFSEIEADKRADIRQTMTSRKQLDAAKHPTLGGRLASKPVVDGQEFSVVLELEVKGKKVERQIEGRFEVADGRLTIEAAGPFNFTDFEIKPYSAMLGAVKNSDRFHVFLHLEATRQP